MKEYKLTENIGYATVLDKMEKAEQSVQGTNGAEGMLYSIQSGMVCVIKIVLSAAVMSILSPVIAAAALALSLLNYWFQATFLNNMISLLQKGMGYGYIIHGTYKEHGRQEHPVHLPQNVVL